MTDVGTSLPLPSSPVGISPSLPEPVSDSSLSPGTYQVVTIAFFFASLVLSLLLLVYLVYRAILRRRRFGDAGAVLDQLEGGARAGLSKPPELFSRDAVVVIQPDGQAELACLEAPVPASVTKATQVSEEELELPVASSYPHTLAHLQGPMPVEAHLAALARLGHQQQGGPQPPYAQWGALYAGSAGQGYASGTHRQQGAPTEAGRAGSSHADAACQAG